MSFLGALVDTADEVIGDLEAPYALIQSANRYIGTIVADVTVREVSTDEDTITVHPVETGTPVSDHVFANPQIIEITCGFSDSSAGFTGYAQQVYQEFLALKNTRQPFDVSTGKRLYTSMLFRAVTVVTDAESEFALSVIATLQQVIISQTSGGGGSADTQADPASTAPEADTGTKTLQSTTVPSGLDPVSGFAAPIAMATSVPSGLNPTSGFGAVPLT